MNTNTYSNNRNKNSLYPLIQPPQIPEILRLPFNIAGRAISTITNSELMKGLSAAIYQELRKNAGAFSQIMNDSEIKFLISQLVKDFLTFFGDIIKEVGTDATNEFLQIFFQMLLDAGKKMISGFTNVTIGLLMSALGEIPVAGGIADVVITVINSFNDVIGAITPIINTSVKVITSGAHIIDKANDTIFNNPVLDNINTNFSKFSAKVFNGVSFFNYLANMFGSMKDNVDGLYKNNDFSMTSSMTTSNPSNYLKKSLLNVTENALSNVQDKAISLDREMNAASHKSIMKGGKKVRFQTKKRRNIYYAKKSNKKRYNKKTKRYRRK